MKKLLSALFCTVLMSHASAGIRQYSANLENSQWTVSENTRLNCTLSHVIPNYGEAKFTSTASRRTNMMFELDMLRLPDNYSLAEVRSVAPKYRPGMNDYTIADMKLHKQFAPSLNKKVAWTMLTELEQGMSPTFFYNDWYNDRDKIAVGLSNARFKRAYHEFVGCVGNLLDYGIEDISYTVLNYESNSDKFTKASERRMRMISDYLKLDTDLELVLIDAYSDSYGGRWNNLKLSERRANKIREFFVNAGIAPERIEATGYGEKRHIASNDTTLGRGKNRRVVIQMEKPQEY
ncbi:OmpA family protein [Thalassotalea euphylliae]|uniref:flagellar protein MotY n=1 Tax=Thalassotalea euphylliae TaxID=1655234 RepID=UPI003630C5AE